MIPGSGRSPGEGIGYPLNSSWASLVAQLVKNRLQCGRPGFDPWVGQIPWRRVMLPIPGFWLGHKKSHMTKRLSHHFSVCQAVKTLLGTWRVPDKCLRIPSLLWWGAPAHTLRSTPAAHPSLSSLVCCLSCPGWPLLPLCGLRDVIGGGGRGREPEWMGVPGGLLSLPSLKFPGQ